MTRRECQALPLICQAMTNKEIAHSMGIAVKTAEVYVRGVLHEHGVRNKGELIIKMLTTEDARDYL